MSRVITTTPFEVAMRFVGVREQAGPSFNPQILSMLKLDAPSVVNDETPWCSAFVNYIAFLLGCRRSRSLAARSWLSVGTSVDLAQATSGFHVVVLSRGGGQQPGPHVLNAPGHVGFFVSRGPTTVTLLGGNQNDEVNISTFPTERILGIREI
jgi:uncharacterized protein (TIGR02594 family)